MGRPWGQGGAGGARWTLGIVTAEGNATKEPAQPGQPNYPTSLGNSSCLDTSYFIIFTEGKIVICFHFSRSWAVLLIAAASINIHEKQVFSSWKMSKNCKQSSSHMGINSQNFNIVYSLKKQQLSEPSQAKSFWIDNFQTFGFNSPKPLVEKSHSWNI